MAEQLERRLPGLRAVPGHVRVRDREPQDLDDDEVHLRPKVRVPQGGGMGGAAGRVGGTPRLASICRWPAARNSAEASSSGG